MDRKIKQDWMEQLFIHQGVARPTEPLPPSLRQSEAYTQSLVDQADRIDIVRRLVCIEEALEEQSHFFKINSVFVNTLGSSNWEIARPLAVTVEQRSENDFVACLYDLDLYGYGDTVPESLEDLKSVIINQYEYLLECQDTLSDGLQKQLEFLRSLLVPKNG